MESEVLPVLETEVVSADENPSAALEGRAKKRERKIERSDGGRFRKRTRRRRWKTSSSHEKKKGTNGGDVVSGDLDGHFEG